MNLGFYRVAVASDSSATISARSSLFRRVGSKDCRGENNYLRFVFALTMLLNGDVNPALLNAATRN